jgi:hypothetical protein
MWMTHNMKNTFTDSIINEYIINEVDCDEERELLLAAHERYASKGDFKYRLLNLKEIIPAQKLTAPLKCAKS